MMILNKKNIVEYAEKYNKRVEGSFDEFGEKELKEWFIKNRYLDKKNFIRLGRWKSRRPIKHYQSNDDSMIKEITRLSLTTKNEEIQIKLLFLLKGVSWPVASVFLHFAFPDKYSIMDYRAIWSLGWENPKSYNFKFWQRYCNEIRKIANKLALDIRTVDKALWQYSKENQNKYS